MAKPTTVRGAVLDLLRHFGMTTIFGNPGSTELPMFREWPDDFRYILGLQESCVLGMADGFAQATRNAAFVNLHSAAGVGNALGNIFTAFKNRTPLVITAGQQARAILPTEPFLFALQATEFPKPYVKWSNEPARAQDVPAAIARAYYMAMQPPCGPTFVSVPIDDWDAETQLVAPRQVSTALRPDPAALGPLVEALDRSERPVFVIGDAVERDRGGFAAAVRLAERYNALVWVSPMSGRCSFPETHPLFAGFLPAMREQIVASLAGHDVILALGAPVFTYHVEGFGPYIPAGSTLFQVIDDPQMASFSPVGQAVVSSLRLAMEDLLARAEPRPRATPNGRPVPPRAEASHPISVAYVMQTVAETRPGNSIIVEEAPSSRPIMQTYLPITASNGFYTCSSGGLGHGLPASIGVALARPDEHVVALIGDGSAMYAIQSLWTAAQLGLRMTVVILRNGRYEALHQFGKLFGLPETVGTMLPGLDFVDLARGQGFQAFRIERAQELAEALRPAYGSDRPTLIEVAVA
ncbi:MAG: benzoylformate decarboxylase [Acidisphaera sp.]|nr:benzoylformate decarboxylase [Acidisphaera sp.]